VRCEQSGVLVPKDKAIKRFIVRNIVDASAIRDITQSCVYDSENSLRSRQVRSVSRRSLPVAEDLSESILLCVGCDSLQDS